MILVSDKSVSAYTGLPCKNALTAIYDVINKRVKKIEYWKGPKHFQKNMSKKGSGGRKKRYGSF